MQSGERARVNLRHYLIPHFGGSFGRRPAGAPFLTPAALDSAHQTPEDGAPMKGLLRIAVLVVFAAIPAVALAASSASSQVWVTNCNKEQYKPILITVTCGDGSTYVNKLTWSSWSASTASGKGDYAYNTCTPNCAAGHIRSYPVTAVLSQPKSCSKQKHKVFNNLEVTFTSGRPSYVHKATYKLALGCPF
jgi:hypothetical protein